MNDENKIWAQYQKTMDNMISTNSHLLNKPPNFGNNNNEVKPFIKKNEDLTSILENKNKQEREPLLSGYKEVPANFNYQEEKTDSLISSPLFIIMTIMCMIIYGIIFYMISLKN